MCCISCGGLFLFTWKRWTIVTLVCERGSLFTQCDNEYRMVLSLSFSLFFFLFLFVHVCVCIHLVSVYTGAATPDCFNNRINCGIFYLYNWIISWLRPSSGLHCHYTPDTASNTAYTLLRCVSWLLLLQWQMGRNIM